MQGIVMVGNGGAAYFQFRLPPGVSSVFLLVRVVASDDPNNTVDFYATRNVLWTKSAPERDDLESSYILPILTKDADRSAQAADYMLSFPVVCSTHTRTCSSLCPVLQMVAACIVAWHDLSSHSFEFQPLRGVSQFVWCVECWTQMSSICSKGPPVNQPIPKLHAGVAFLG
jgi:hypothetical protein